MHQNPIGHQQNDKRNLLMLKYTKYFTLEVIKIQTVIKSGDKLAIQCKCGKILFGINRMTRDIYLC